MSVAACQSMGRASFELEMGTIRATLPSGIRLAAPLVKNAGIGDGVDQYGMTGIIGIKAIAAAARPAIVVARPPTLILPHQISLPRLRGRAGWELATGARTRSRNTARSKPMAR